MTLPQVLIQTFLASGPFGAGAFYLSLALAGRAIYLILRRAERHRFEPVVWLASLPLIIGALGVPIGLLKVKMQIESSNDVMSMMMVAWGGFEVYYGLYLGLLGSLLVLFLAGIGAWRTTRAGSK